VPPPPVCGAAVTTGVGDAATVARGVGDGVGLAVRVTVGVARTVAVAAGVTRAELPPVGVGRTELLVVGTTLAVGTNVVADARGLDAGDEQADTAARPRTAIAPKPTAVSNARGVRTLLRYPAGQL
jgi:hypothetical protein